MILFTNTAEPSHLFLPSIVFVTSFVTLFWLSSLFSFVAFNRSYNCINSSRGQEPSSPNGSIYGHWLVLFVNLFCRRSAFLTQEATRLTPVFSNLFGKVLMFAFLLLKCLFGWVLRARPRVVGGFTCNAVNTALSPLTLMHRLPGCYKSFYNKLHEALWCLNIYGSLSFPRGLFLSKYQQH